MATTLPAFSAPFETVDASVTVDEIGFADVSISYYAPSAVSALALADSGVVCPLVSAGIVSSTRFERGQAVRQEGDIWLVTLYWKGIAPSFDLDASKKPRYTPSNSTEPIETHPLFRSFAGTPGTPLNGAVFDEDGLFVRFDVEVDGGPNPKAGVDSYYLAGITVTEERIITSGEASKTELYFDVGKIDAPEIGSLPKVKLRMPGVTDFDQNYILLRCEMEEIGGDYIKLNREWLGSGPRGWDTDIYEYADTGDAI